MWDLESALWILVVPASISRNCRSLALRSQSGGNPGWECDASFDESMMACALELAREAQ